LQASHSFGGGGTTADGVDLAEAPVRTEDWKTQGGVFFDRMQTVKVAQEPV